MVGWHHRLNEHEFEQAPGDGEGREAWRAAVHGVTRVGHDFLLLNSNNQWSLRLSPYLGYL